jgi:predicted RNA-binding Zn-ribbon protein involved in translation (DUF1610 family)
LVPVPAVAISTKFRLALWRPGTFAVAYWLLLLPTLVLPAVVIVRHRRRRLRERNNLCPKCGYDLRASPERCPECGTEVKP